MTRYVFIPATFRAEIEAENEEEAKKKIAKILGQFNNYDWTYGSGECLVPLEE